jgi:hypothetical protein
MSQDYAENKLKIPVSKYLPVLPGADEELKPAIGRVDLSWRCLGLGPYKQRTTFYIAPNASFDVLFGQETESLQKGKFSWDAAISKGAMKSFKSKKGGESLISSTESGKPARQSSCLSFEQGIRNGILIPVDADVDHADEAGLRPSIAELEKFYFSDGMTTSSIGDTLRAADNARPSQHSHSFENEQLQQSQRQVRSGKPDADESPANATQKKVEQWFEKCGESQRVREEGANDCELAGCTTGFAAAERNTEERPFPALSVEQREGVKSRRPSEGEESTNKRRRSGFIENLDFENANLSAPGSSSSILDTTSTQQKQADHVPHSCINSLHTEPRPNESVQVTTKTVPRTLAKDVPLSPTGTRRHRRRSSRAERSFDTRSSRRDSSNFLESSNVDRTETHDSVPNYRFEPSFLPPLNATNAKITGSSSFQWQPQTSGYTLEQFSLDEALASLEYPQSPVSRRQSSPIVPRSHHDLTKALHMRTASIPGVVTETDKEGRDYPNMLDFSQDLDYAQQAYHIRSLSGKSLLTAHFIFLTHVDNTIESTNSANSATENPEITSP